jgi:hypothetical protein
MNEFLNNVSLARQLPALVKPENAVIYVVFNIYYFIHFSYIQ